MIKIKLLKMMMLMISQSAYRPGAQVIINNEVGHINHHITILIASTRIMKMNVLRNNISTTCWKRNPFRKSLAWMVTLIVISFHDIAHAVMARTLSSPQAGTTTV